jgi:hypothetical protein
VWTKQKAAHRTLENPRRPALKSYRAQSQLYQKASQYQEQSDKALQATLARALGTNPLPPDQAPSLVPENSPWPVAK